MARNLNHDRYDRYSNLGGLATIARRYEHGDITISALAKIAGCSRGTIHNDFIRLLGAERYALLQQNRKRTTNVPRLDIPSIRNVLIQKSEGLSAEDTHKANSLVDILALAEKAHVPLRGIKRKGVLRFCLPNEQTIRIRIAIVVDEQPEHRFGLHRFRISPTITSHNFVIFGIRAGYTTTTYIFNTLEIAHIQSLALRFKWFDRKSRYDYARDRWSLLTE